MRRAPPLAVLAHLLFGAPILLFCASWAYELDGQRVLMRPLVMAFGKTQEATVSSKRQSKSGDYVEVNFQLTPDSAPRVEVPVNDAGYEAIKQYSSVKIRYLTWLPSYVELDEDFGNASETARGLWVIPAAVVLSALWVGYRRRSRRTPS